MHVQAWREEATVGMAGPLLLLRLTDGLHGWKAELGPAQLEQLAAENQFGREQLEQYLEHTLASFSHAETSITLVTNVLESTLSWSRMCLLENVRESIGGRAHVSPTDDSLADIRPALSARLSADAAAIAALERSIAAITAETRLVLEVTEEANGRLVALESTLVSRFVAELNAKKRALKAAQKGDRDTDREDEGEDGEEEASGAPFAPASSVDASSRAEGSGSGAAPSWQPARPPQARRSAMDMLADDDDSDG